MNTNFDYVYILYSFRIVKKLFLWVNHLSKNGFWKLITFSWGLSFIRLEAYHSGTISRNPKPKFHLFIVFCLLKGLVIFIATLRAQKVTNQLQDTDFGREVFTKFNKKAKFTCWCNLSMSKLDELWAQEADTLNCRFFGWKTGI
jgi:hypothetical protein